jgi:intergrase/recombinase
LNKNYRKNVADDRFRYARKFYHCLENRDFSKLRMLSDYKRSHVMKALAALAKHLGIYNEFRDLVKRYGLKWTTRNSDELIISRLTKPNNADEIVEWIKSVKHRFPLLSNFADLVMASGLRFEEAVNAYNLIVDLAAKGRLNEYYNAERDVLEHFRYKELFIRRSKKVFISFVPDNLIRKVATSHRLTLDTIRNRVKRAGLRSRWSDVREFYASFATKYLKEPEIDFLQGRVSASVFMRHYFNPAWITDLKQRAIKTANEILVKIN